MADQEPETNGALPPKISLKPKLQKPAATQPPAQSPETAEIKVTPTTPTEKPKPILSVKPATETPQEKPSAKPTIGPKPILSVKPANAPRPTLSAIKPADAPKPTLPTIKPAEVPAVPTAVQEDKPQEQDTAIPKAEQNDETQEQTAAVNSDKTGDDVTATAAPPPAAPKRPVLRPLGAATGAAAPKPVPLGLRKDGPDPKAVPGTKQSTSRITIPTAAEKSTTGQIKTIKIPPRSQSGKIDGVEAATEDAPKPAVVADPKRQTSRISLESVLGNQSGSPSSPNAPATIKIKRAPAIGKAQSNIKTLSRSAEPTPEPEETEATDATDATPESQKKTLKVKRPAVSSNERPSVGSAAPMFAPPVASKAHFAEPDPHWAFSIIAIAATLVAAVLLYVMAAQITTPDLTETTSSDANWPWPARLDIK